MNWNKITVKYPNRCVQCRILIEEGEEALYMEKVGLKHEECPTEIPIDKDPIRLVVIDDEDKKNLGW